MRAATILLFGLSLTACNEPPTATSQPVAGGLDAAVPRTEALGAKLSADRYELIADGVYEGPALDVADVLAEPARFAGDQPLRLAGEIVSVCQNKGCWLRMGSDETNLFVKFGQCDRYVPKDAAGRAVLVEGLLTMEEVSVDEQRHLLEDAGKHEEAAQVSAPVRQPRFQASGAAIAKAQ